jgi:hypothetical protein
MKSFWWLTVAEIRLTLRSKSFWLLGALAVALSLMTSLDLLLILFISIVILKRDERADLAELMATLPYNPFKLSLARVLAALLLLLGMWPLMVGVVVGVTGTAEWLMPKAQIGLLALKYLVTCITAIGFVFLAGTMTRSAGQLYLLAGIGWAVSFVFASNRVYFPAWMVLLAFGHGALLPDAPSAELGYFTQQGWLLPLAVYQGVVAVLCMLIGIARQMYQRGELLRGIKQLLLWSLLAMVGAGVAGSMVCHNLHLRDRGFRLALQDSRRQRLETTRKAKTVKPDLAAYRLDLNLHTATHGLEGTAELKLKWDSSAAANLVFTLRPYLKVREIKLVGQAGVLPWRRAGSRVTVLTPGRSNHPEMATLRIKYYGTVWEWASGRIVRPDGPVNLITPKFSLLRSGYAWYPIPGAAALFCDQLYQDPWSTIPKTVPWARLARHSPVPFELKVRLDSNSTVVSNLELQRELSNGRAKREYWFSSRRGSDVYLITGPYHHQKLQFPNHPGWLDCYCFGAHRRQLRRVWESLAVPYRFYEKLLQPEGVAAGKIGTVVEIPVCFTYTDDGRAVKDLFLKDTVALTENYFRVGKRSLGIVAEMQANKRDFAILQRWWPEDPTRDEWKYDGQISESLMLYCATLGLEKRWGAALAKVYREKYFELITMPSFGGGPIVRDVFTIIDALRRSPSAGPEVHRMLGRLYQIYNCRGQVRPADLRREAEKFVKNYDYAPIQVREMRRCLRRLARNARNHAGQRIKLDYCLPLTIVFNQEEWVP